MIEGSPCTASGNRQMKDELVLTEYSPYSSHSR